MDTFRDFVSALVGRKATGRFVFVVDMNQGGIGAVSSYGSMKVNNDEFYIVTNKGCQALTKI